MPLIRYHLLATGRGRDRPNEVVGRANDLSIGLHIDDVIDLPIIRDILKVKISLE